MITTTRIPIGRRRKQEFVFREFFEMGLDLSVSPFVDRLGRAISKNFDLKISCFAAIFLAISFFIHIVYPQNPLSEIFLVIVYLIVGAPSLINSIDDLAGGDLNIDVLMTLAAFSAYFMGSGFEGALLFVLFAVSGALEELVSLKAKGSLRAIHALAPTKALVVDQEKNLVEKAIQDIAVNTIIFVRPHEIVPLDGVVVEGTSFVDLSHMTGESYPVGKKEGDVVVSGSRLMDGALTLRVTHTSVQSTVSKLIELITKAETTKPQLERFFDRLSRKYALSIIGFSFFFALVSPYVLSIDFFGNEGSIYRALAFLIAASPCALILAVPTAYLSALSSLAKKGIVLKGGMVLDALKKCQTVAFDKTGTLTSGKLSLVGIDRSLTATYSDDEVLKIAASIEKYASHPIALALMSHVQKRRFSAYPVRNVQVLPGIGVSGSIGIDTREEEVFVGDVRQAKVVEFSSGLNTLEQMQKRQQEGFVVSVCSIGSEYYLLYFEDTLRDSVKSMVSHVQSLGRDVIMLTGDHYTVAKKVADFLGIDHFEAGLSPEDKLRKVADLTDATGLAMVGDGVNDAPALTRATVGICMGSIGSSISQHVSDALFLRDSIELTGDLLVKADQTARIVKQNLLLALTALIFASIPALCGLIPLWLAVILHEGGTVLVSLNATRLLR